MKISDDTRAVIDALNSYASGNLRKVEDLALMLEVAAETLDDQSIQGMCFNGTSMWKLFALLQKTPSTSENYPRLETEFAHAMNSVRAHLAQLVDKHSDNEIEHIRQRYLDINAEAMRNLRDLSHDLSLFKDMQNELRRYKGDE